MAQAISLHPRPYFRVDNSIVDDYGEKIGAIGLAIYNVLARHADRKTGISFPAIGTIAKKLKLGRTTVKKYLRILQNYDLIASSPRYTDAGDHTSNSYLILDPSPEKIALRRLQRERLVNGYYASPQPEEGRSPADPPPSPTATDPQSAADHEQESGNKNIGTSVPPSVPTKPDRRATCHHPVDEIAHLSDGLIICNHCYGLLDGNGGVIDTLPAVDTTRAA